VAILGEYGYRVAMLLWDQIWQHEWARINALTDESRQHLATLCILSVWKRLDPDLARHGLLCDAMKSLSKGRIPDDDFLDALIGEAQDRHIPGLWDLSMAVSALAESSGRMSARDSMKIISFAYQTVLDCEILSRLDRETLEREVSDLESANAACREVINEQINLLRSVEQGG
jgi:hypothetical protein